MKKTLPDVHDGTLQYDYEYRCARVAEMQRNNRRVAVIALVIAVGLLLASAAYINWFGGSNRGAMRPLHSTLDMPGSARLV